MGVDASMKASSASPRRREEHPAGGELLRADAVGEGAGHRRDDGDVSGRGVRSSPARCGGQAAELLEVEGQKERDGEGRDEARAAGSTAAEVKTRFLQELGSTSGLSACRTRTTRPAEPDDREHRAHEERRATSTRAPRRTTAAR